ncbi:MAG: hypothetical protein HRU15_10510 [Planctomycetes bacterium]|nr:hypothetical protein [Planctomycetota bacterium]
MFDEFDNDSDINRRGFLMNLARVVIGGSVAYAATDLFIKSLDCEGHSVCDACLAPLREYRF